MSDEDKKKALIISMKAYSKTVSSSEDERKKFLKKTGMYTTNGKLKAVYR